MIFMRPQVLVGLFDEAAVKIVFDATSPSTDHFKEVSAFCCRDLTFPGVISFGHMKNE